MIETTEQKLVSALRTTLDRLNGHLSQPVIHNMGHVVHLSEIVERLAYTATKLGYNVQ